MLWPSSQGPFAANWSLMTSIQHKATLQLGEQFSTNDRSSIMSGMSFKAYWCLSDKVTCTALPHWMGASLSGSCYWRDCVTFTIWMKPEGGGLFLVCRLDCEPHWATCQSSQTGFIKLPPLELMSCRSVGCGWPLHSGLTDHVTNWLDDSVNSHQQGKNCFVHIGNRWQVRMVRKTQAQSPTNVCCCIMRVEIRNHSQAVKTNVRELNSPKYCKSMAV